MYFWIHFTTEELPVVLGCEETDIIFSDPRITSQRLDESAMLPLMMNVKNPDPIHQTFHDLLFEQENPSYTKLKYQTMFQTLLITLTEGVIASYQPYKTGNQRSSVAYDIVGYVSEHLTDENLSVKFVAAAIGLNPDYAGRRFKEAMGISVGDYIQKKRIELAVRHLQETTDPVGRIAKQCGFTSVRHFLRQFKSEKGLTPSEVRKRFRTMHVNTQ